ncbi:MAG: (deoxy)nucleoside triphosphate pyrophosphohydrolase [Pirellulales bacterium]
MPDAAQPLIDSSIASSISIAVVEHDGRILVGRRPPGAVLAGLWEFPGGKVHHRETPAHAAIRECHEEAGIEVEVIGLYDERLYEYDHALVHLRYFACRPLDSSQQPRPPFRWVDRQHLSRYQFPPANEELLRRLVQTPERGHEVP